jgi:DNA-binding HxlR family transcriptional regulator
VPSSSELHLAEGLGYPMRCSIAGALVVVGDRWSLQIVREIAQGIRRYEELQQNIGLPRDALTMRLRRLELQGVLRSESGGEQPPRLSYSLTSAGEELEPILLALREWGDRHVFADDPPAVFRHTCGAEFHPVTACAACGQVIAAGEVHERHR